MALRCRARLEPGDALARLHESVTLLHPYPFDEARSRLALGEASRRSGRIADARAALSVAADVFTAMGARPWTSRAESGLRATGVRRARREAGHERLTEQELQVALLIADGATNKEAAAALMLSPKTVAYHLAKVFRRLAVTDRTQLARALGPSHAAS